MHVRACALNEMAPTIQGEFTRGLVLCEIFYQVKQAIFGAFAALVLLYVVLISPLDK